MLVGAVLARNEAGRYLKEVIANLTSLCDTVLVVDDHSTDHTVAQARKAGAKVIPLGQAGEGMWGNESPARQILWERACEEAGDGWIYFADADHITYGNLRDLTKSWQYNAWAFPLYDVWTPERDKYRADGPWCGHLFPRIWMVSPSRVPEGWQPEWSGRGVHSGHLPVNFPVTYGVVPTDTYIAHLGYSTLADRQQRAERYAVVDAQLSDFERHHASTILDPL